MSACVMSGQLKVRYVREICYGMCYLHSMKIIHRDLKPSNVLVVSDDDEDIDFVDEEPKPVKLDILSLKPEFSLLMELELFEEWAKMKEFSLEECVNW